MRFSDDFDHINVVKCNRVKGHIFEHLKINKRQQHMMQDLNCSLFKLLSYNVGLPYGDLLE